MDPISLRNISDDEKRALEEAFRTNTRDKIIIYVEDRRDVGGVTKQLMEFRADPSAQIHWVKTGEDALGLIAELRANDPHKAAKMLIITDDDTQSMIDGQALIRRVHNDASADMKNMPAVLFTGFSMPQQGIESDVVTFMDEHTAATAKPFNLYVISKALEVLERQRGTEATESAGQTRDAKKTAEFSKKSDTALEDIIRKGEKHYHTMRAREQSHDQSGLHIARSDQRFWENNKPPHENPERMWAAQRDAALEEVGYARAELARRHEKPSRSDKDTPYAGKI